MSLGKGLRASCCSGHLIRFRLKPGAKPVARQPIPLSPFDEMRVEYHIEENASRGKLRKVIPPGSNFRSALLLLPCLIRNVKGLLGGMVRGTRGKHFPLCRSRSGFGHRNFQDLS